MQVFAAPRGRGLGGTGSCRPRRSSRRVGIPAKAAAAAASACAPGASAVRCVVCTRCSALCQRRNNMKRQHRAAAWRPCRGCLGAAHLAPEAGGFERRGLLRRRPRDGEDALSGHVARALALGHEIQLRRARDRPPSERHVSGHTQMEPDTGGAPNHCRAALVRVTDAAAGSHGAHGRSRNLWT